jgi:hypothetical protein
MKMTLIHNVTNIPKDAIANDIIASLSAQLIYSIGNRRHAGNKK